MRLKLAPFITLCACLIAISATAQYEPGYVVLNSGDTLRGQIHPYLTPDLNMYRKVRFRKDDTKITFEPYQIKAYWVNYETFITKYFGEKHRQLVFFKVIVKGYCSYYQTKIANGITYNGMGMPITNIIGGLYFQREGEELHPVNFNKLKLGLDLYFLDNPTLTYDIHNKKYKDRDIEKIVIRYNKERAEKIKANPEKP